MNDERRKEIQKKYRDSPKGKEKGHLRYQSQYRERMYMKIKYRAKLKGIEFNIDLEDIIIPTVCPYLGAPMIPIMGKGKVWTNPSLDRIDYSKGYIKGNVEVISYLANSMKQAATKEQLLSFAKSIQEKYAN